MVSEVMEEYALDSAEVAYEDLGLQAPMGFMAAGGVFHDGIFLTGGIINTPPFPARIPQTITTGRPPQCT